MKNADKIVGLTASTLALLVLLLPSKAPPTGGGGDRDGPLQLVRAVADYGTIEYGQYLVLGLESVAYAAHREEVEQSVYGVNDDIWSQFGGEGSAWIPP